MRWLGIIYIALITIDFVIAGRWITSSVFIIYLGPRSKKSAGASTFDLTFQDVWQSKRILEDAQFLATATTITSTHSAAAAASASAAAAAAADTHNSTITHT